jgi:hypothetical protein
MGRRGDERTPHLWLSLCQRAIRGSSSAEGVGPKRRAPNAPVRLLRPLAVFAKAVAAGATAPFAVGNIAARRTVLIGEMRDRLSLAGTADTASRQSDSTRSVADE